MFDMANEVADQGIDRCLELGNQTKGAREHDSVEERKPLAELRRRKGCKVARGKVAGQLLVQEMKWAVRGVLVTTTKRNFFEPFIIKTCMLPTLVTVEAVTGNALGCFSWSLWVFDKAVRVGGS